MEVKSNERIFTVSDVAGDTENPFKYAKIDKYVAEKCKFHGSPKGDLQILRPNYPKDDGNDRTDKSFNEDNAVFATDSPAGAVIFACMSTTNVPKEEGDGKNWSVRGSIDGVLVEIPLTWKKYLTGNTGFLYVLSDDNDWVDKDPEKKSWQTKCRDEVAVIDTIPVEFADIERLGGKIEWK